MLTDYERSLLARWRKAWGRQWKTELVRYLRGEDRAGDLWFSLTARDHAAGLRSLARKCGPSFQNLPALLRGRPANARFWVYANGSWVKLTLWPDEAVRHYRYDPTDEGWSARTLEWTHTGDGVFHESWEEWLDCDGRGESYREAECGLADLREMKPWRDETGTVEGLCPPQPKWKYGDKAYQRDFTAEAAGY